MKISVLLCVWLSLLSMADEKPKTATATSPLYLYRLDGGSRRPSSFNLVPNRIYTRDREGKTLYLMTDERGELASPQEILLPGSVIPGSYLGEKLGKRNYRLKSDGQWISSQEELSYQFRVESEPPMLKTITFEPPERHSLAIAP